MSPISLFTSYSEEGQLCMAAREDHLTRAIEIGSLVSQYLPVEIFFSHSLEVLERMPPEESMKGVKAIFDMLASSRYFLIFSVSRFFSCNSMIWLEFACVFWECCKVGEMLTIDMSMSSRS